MDAVLERIAGALERIAAAMELAVTPAPAPTAQPACPHPMRLDFGVTNGVADWQCTTCGYRTVPPPPQAPPTSDDPGVV